MTQTQIRRQEPDIETTDLAEIMASFKNDPLGFVLWAFPWGEPGTSLQDEYPDRWQIAVLEDIRSALELNEALPDDEKIPIQIAVASGHGIGKTALMAMINLWFISTHDLPRTVVTANTGKQLSAKTWAELHKWHNMMVHKHLFLWSAERYALKENLAEWRSDAIPWSKENSEAFAGTHAENVLYLFDEGSAIEDGIWEVSEGAMTTKCCLWIVFGNPTRNTGRFRACFGKFRHRWITRSIDSRTARKTNKAKIRQWIEDYGIDSDFVRIRVLGRFPRQASNQLIAEEAVDACIAYDAIGYEMYPVAICCDVARFGDDLSTVGAYQGKKTHELKGYNGKNVVETATLVAECYRYHRERTPYNIEVRIFVDDIGVGGGVVDILHTWGLPVTGVNSGGRSSDPDKWLNIRAEMWWKAREATQEGKYDLPDEPRLKEDLINIEYFMTANQKIQLEAVRDLKERDLPSPDYGTNFVLQFAYPLLLGVVDKTRPNKVRKNSGSTIMQKRREHGYGKQETTSRRRLQ